MSGKIKILVAPLDWGLGHATRCIPIIRELQKQGAEVLLGISGNSGLLLREEFPELKSIALPAYDVSYPKKGGMAKAMLLQGPKILRAIYREHRKLKYIIREENIQALVSDNRYGLFNKRIPSVFICHQLNIISPLFSPLIRRINHWFIEKYRECWVPDWEKEPNLSGKLSHGKPSELNIKYIGPLSRFNPNKVEIEREEALAILSGPEPQRSILEKKLLEELSKLDLPATLIQGIPGTKEQKVSENLRLIPNMDSQALEQKIRESRYIICRSGYSSIMDLVQLNKTALLIPTPGQTEQEYLASYHHKHGFIRQRQKKINLEKGFGLLKKASFKRPDASGEILPAIVSEFLSGIKDPPQ